MHLATLATSLETLLLCYQVHIMFKAIVDVGGNKVNKLYCRCKICKQLLRRQQVYMYKLYTVS